MKISTQNPNIIKQTYGGKLPTTQQISSDKKSQTKGTTNVDNVNLSSSTRDLQKIEQAMDIEPGGRANRIAALKQEIESGTYKVDSEKIAEKMTGFFLDKMA